MNVSASTTNTEARKALRNLALQIPELRRAATDGLEVERAVVKHFVLVISEELEETLPQYCGYHAFFHNEVSFKDLSWEPRRAPYTATLETRDKVVALIEQLREPGPYHVPPNVFRVEVSEVLRITNTKGNFAFTGITIHVELQHPIAGLDLDATILVSLERPNPRDFQ